MTSMPPPTVLVVDDEPLILWSVSERLRAEGYDVLEAGTGRAAIQHCEKPVDLVLLDSGLPDLEGLSVLTHLLKLHPDLPVILVTADPAMEGASEALQLRSIPACQQAVPARRPCRIGARRDRGRQFFPRSRKPPHRLVERDATGLANQVRHAWQRRC